VPLPILSSFICNQPVAPGHRQLRGMIVILKVLPCLVCFAESAGIIYRCSAATVLTTKKLMMLVLQV